MSYIPGIIDGLWKAERGMDELISALGEDDCLRREAKAIQTAFRDRRRALENLENFAVPMKP